MSVIPPGKVGDRFVATFVAVTLLLFLAIVGLVIYMVIRVTAVENANAALSRANAANAVIARNDNIASCQQSNTSRTEDIGIATAAQRAAVARDLKLVDQAYALRDCAALYGTGR
jgi:predicted ATPase